MGEQTFVVHSTAGERNRVYRVYRRPAAALCLVNHNSYWKPGDYKYISPVLRNSAFLPCCVSHSQSGISVTRTCYPHPYSQLVRKHTADNEGESSKSIITLFRTYDPEEIHEKRAKPNSHVSTLLQIRTAAAVALLYSTHSNTHSRVRRLLCSM